MRLVLQVRYAILFTLMVIRGFCFHLWLQVPESCCFRFFSRPQMSVEGEGDLMLSERLPEEGRRGVERDYPMFGIILSGCRGSRERLTKFCCI